MKNVVKEIVNWFFQEGINATREELESRLYEAYEKGKDDIHLEIINKTLDDIHHNTILKVKKEKQELLEKNFYKTPSEDDIIKMKSYEYIEQHISEIISNYRNNK